MITQNKVAAIEPFPQGGDCQFHRWVLFSIKEYFFSLETISAPTLFSIFLASALLCHCLVRREREAVAGMGVGWGGGGGKEILSHLDIKIFSYIFFK